MSETTAEHKLPPPGTRMTAAEFLALPETAARIELIDGVVVYPFGWEGEAAVSPAPDLSHQLVAARVFTLLSRLIPGGTLLFAPVDFRLDDNTVIQPDVLWIAPDSACARREGGGYRGVPDLAVQVLSPATAKHDRVYKFRAYETHGCREYWLADPANVYLEVWTLRGSRFERLGVFAGDDVFESPALGGRSVPVQEIFAPVE